MSSLLENHIVELLMAHDEKAISLLYDNYADTLYGAAFKVVKDEDLAKDVVQESFVKIWRKSDSYDPKKAKLFTWIYRITRNTAIDKLRSISNKTDKEIQLDVSDVYTLGKDHIKPDLLDLQEHLDKLEDKYKVVLEALYMQGMTQQEASEDLDIPLGTVKSRLKVGLREMRKIYQETAILLLLVLCI